MSGAGRGVIWNKPNKGSPDRGRGVPFPAGEDTPGPVVYRIVFRRLAVVGSCAKTHSPFFPVSGRGHQTPFPGGFFFFRPFNKR